VKCENSTFNAQGSRVIIGVVHVGVIKIYVVEVKCLRKRKHMMKFILAPNLMVL
jgi:hypothetical protein